MIHVTTLPNPVAVAEIAASQAVEIIQRSVDQAGSCVWVLAGGSTPTAAYQIIADKYLDDVDWSKVTIVIGDERIAPLDSSESNWHNAEQALLRHIPQADLIRPKSDGSLPEAARDYAARLGRLAADGQQPVFDLVWLGIGEDGHTLSLFPDNPAILDSCQLVLSVTDSPKPPAERITLSLHALRAAKYVSILVAGVAKAQAVAKALQGDDLPVAKAATVASESGGKVEWLIDEAAGSLIQA